MSEKYNSLAHSRAAKPAQTENKLTREKNKQQPNEDSTTKFNDQIAIKKKGKLRPPIT
jgi:hypothetical protein